MDETTPEIFRIAGYSILRWSGFSLVLDIEKSGEPSPIKARALHFYAKEKGGRKVRSHALLLPRNATPDEPRRAKLDFRNQPLQIFKISIETEDGQKIPLNTRITQQYAQIYKIEPA